MKFAFFASIAVGIIISVLVITGLGNDTTSTPSSDTPLPQIINGVQMIDITARGGYKPKQTIAKANIPSVIRMKTQSTFDCSSSLIIPSIGYSASLPATGMTEIPIPSQKPGSTLRGMCGMGMYSFSIIFS